MAMMQTRRRFLTSLAVAGAAGLAHAPRVLAAEGALETTTVRISRDPSTCTAPLFVAEELLRAEGFTEVRYVAMPAPDQPSAIARGRVDFGPVLVSMLASLIDAGEPVSLLAGFMAGCFELFGNQDIRSIAQLKGKSVGLKGSPPDLLTLMAAQVGLDPVKDLRWVTDTDASVDPLELFAEGKIDAFLGFAPEPQELRARHAGHVIVNSAVDRPWSQYFCCFLAGNREYVRKYPVATKRVLRAILKATDLCATEPARAARRIVDGGFAARYDYALQTLNENLYDKWREYDPEDTVRFYALRLHEAGLIKSSPNKIIADGTDWRFLNELKRELKA
jgi:NitT/TauT family transport system substrate-binding protein